ncbi:ribonuclease H-like domain-containing protein [Tanacetum coccineum]|uniref:Ribonuclease H-like domain-containing protein n=1 Tax=Tanacetum coccineum TaxID=301880 RepID=A0ABQ5F0R2_9ASTR
MNTLVKDIVLWSESRMVLCGGKRRISIGIKTYGKSSGEEVNSVPNYLRASLHRVPSCHDILSQYPECKQLSQANRSSVQGPGHKHLLDGEEAEFKRSIWESFFMNDMGEERVVDKNIQVNGKIEEELPENSTIMPTVIESSHASSDKEVSEVSLCAHFRLSCRKDAHGLLNNIIEETASKLAESRKSKVKALVGAFETVISLSKTANPLPCNEELSIAPLVVDNSHASSDKEESLIAPPTMLSESSDNEKEVAAAQNDEMDTPSEETPRVKSPIPNYLRASTGSCHDICKYGKRHEHVSEENPRVKSAILPSMELVNPPVCNESKPFSCDDIGEEESFITYTVNERSELIPNEELLEESSIAPLVVESSHASSDKEESLIAPLVSESTQDEGVQEDESEYTDDHNEEVEVSEDESESSDIEKEVAAAQNDKMDTLSEETPRVKSAIPNYLRASTCSCHDICKYGKRHEHVSEETPRVNSAILPSMELVNPPVCNESEPFSWDDIREEESFITYTVNERSELIPDEELPENSTVMPTVIESFHAFSDKEVSDESLIALPVSESTQYEGVLEDESELTMKGF